MRLILGCSYTDHCTQRLGYPVILHFDNAADNSSVLNAAGCLHYDVAPVFYIKIFRIKIIYLSCVPKADSCNFNHSAYFS